MSIYNRGKNSLVATGKGRLLYHIDDLLEEKERALAFLTDGSEFIWDAVNDTGQIGNWRIRSNTLPIRIIIYLRNRDLASSNKILSAQFDGVFLASDNRLKIVKLKHIRHEGFTHCSWLEFMRLKRSYIAGYAYIN